MPSRDVESLRQGGAYDVVTPEEAIALAESLGTDGELTFNPLMAGIDPAAAWQMLDVVQRDVLPFVSD